MDYGFSLHFQAPSASARRPLGGIYITLTYIHDDKLFPL